MVLCKLDELDNYQQSNIIFFSFVFARGIIAQMATILFPASTTNIQTQYKHYNSSSQLSVIQTLFQPFRTVFQIQLVKKNVLI